MSHEGRKTYTLFGVFSVLSTGSFGLPKYLAQQEQGGLAAGTSVAVIFLALAALASLVALILFGLTLARKRKLSGIAFMAGLLPLPIWAGVLFYVWTQINAT